MACMSDADWHWKTHLRKCVPFKGHVCINALEHKPCRTNVAWGGFLPSLVLSVWHDGLTSEVGSVRKHFCWSDLNLSVCSKAQCSHATRSGPLWHKMCLTEIKYHPKWEIILEVTVFVVDRLCGGYLCEIEGNWFLLRCKEMPQNHDDSL